MALNELVFEREYHTSTDNVIEQLIEPCLNNSVMFKRISAYFSGITFQMFGFGLSSLLKKGGHMKLIVSTQLSESDSNAILQGYAERKIIEDKLIVSMGMPEDELEKGYLSLLAYLVAHGFLDVKVAVLPNGIEHEKLGVFIDQFDNAVAFSGSGNQTPSGLGYNSENYDVYCSWKGEDPSSRCSDKITYFDKMWFNQIPRVRTYPFPEAAKNKLLEYVDLVPEQQLRELDDKLVKRYRRERLTKLPVGVPFIPNYVVLRDYQKQAISNWKLNNYRGYLDMATGTGKTFTALSGVCQLAQLANDSDIKSLFCLIVVPRISLALQWEEDCIKFGMKPIVCYSKNAGWHKRLKIGIDSIFLRDSPFECAIITQASVTSDSVLNILSSIKDNVVIVADEAHNLGSEGTSELLAVDFKFRLGLSATMERHLDASGTSRLLTYFQPCCLHYSLADAIAAGYLSRYYYYPIVVCLDDDERGKYVTLSKKISKYSNIADPDECEPLKRLLLKRALIVAGCRAKIPALKAAIKPYVHSPYSVIFCGAVNYTDESDGESAKQIDAVTDLLGNELNMTVSTFVADTPIEQREAIIDNFKKKNLDAIVAIKCLDEGIDIPCISRAFILASSTNPKEYIQRRGRVLRLFNPKEKKHADIFDFITIPRPTKDVALVSSKDLLIESTLVKREISRMKDFLSLSENSADNYELIDHLIDAFRLDEFNIEGDNDYE